jgi:hypothetical protein
VSNQTADDGGPTGFAGYGSHEKPIPNALLICMAMAMRGKFVWTWVIVARD